MIEEHVGGDGSDCGAEEVQVRVRPMELHREVRAFGQIEDLEGHG